MDWCYATYVIYIYIYMYIYIYYGMIPNILARSIEYNPAHTTNVFNFNLSMDK